MRGPKVNSIRPASFDRQIQASPHADHPAAVPGMDSTVNGGRPAARIPGRLTAEPAHPGTIVGPIWLASSAIPAQLPQTGNAVYLAEAFAILDSSS